MVINGTSRLEGASRIRAVVLDKTGT